jgi:hypothetical protein
LIVNAVVKDTLAVLTDALTAAISSSNPSKLINVPTSTSINKNTNVLSSTQQQQPSSDLTDVISESAPTPSKALSSLLPEMSEQKKGRLMKKLSKVVSAVVTEAVDAVVAPLLLLPHASSGQTRKNEKEKKKAIVMKIKEAMALHITTKNYVATTTATPHFSQQSIIPTATPINYVANGYISGTSSSSSSSTSSTESSEWAPSQGDESSSSSDKQVTSLHAFVIKHQQCRNCTLTPSTSLFSGV